MAFTAKFDPGIPQELRALPPRMVVQRKGGLARSSAGPLFVGILFGGIGLAILTFCVGELIFRAVVPDTDATVTNRLIHHGKGTSYEVQYRYVLSGRRLKGSDSVSFVTYDHLQIGQAITIQAAIVGPFSMSELSLPGELGNRAFLWVFALFWNGIAFLGLFNGVIIPKRLVREGTPAMGQITGKQMIPGKNTRYQLSYSYQPFGSETINRTMDVSRDAYDSTILRPAVILFDPMKPKRSVIYEYAPYQAASANLLRS